MLSFEDCVAFCDLTEDEKALLELLQKKLRRELEKAA